MTKYLITTPEFYTQDACIFEKKLIAQIQKHKPEYILYRDKNNLRYQELASVFIRICKKFNGVKFFLHQEPLLAKEMRATGVHLNSTQFDKIEEAKSLGLEVIVSTHSLDEVKKVEKLGVDYVTYSPVFASPNKGEPKGIEDLKNVVEQTELKVFALGGIVEQKQIDGVSTTKAFGFASIRYFF